MEHQQVVLGAAPVFRRLRSPLLRKPVLWLLRFIAWCRALFEETFQGVLPAEVRLKRSPVLIGCVISGNAPISYCSFRPQRVPRESAGMLITWSAAQLGRKEISQITLVVGKWQESYFRGSFRSER